MAVIESQINTDSSDFQDRKKTMTRLVEELDAVLDAIKSGGSESARNKHTARGKLLVRDRIQLLLDKGSPFLEIAPYAACEMYGGDVPSAGIVLSLIHISEPTRPY